MPEKPKSILDRVFGTEEELAEQAARVRDRLRREYSEAFDEASDELEYLGSTDQQIDESINYDERNIDL